MLSGDAEETSDENRQTGRGEDESMRVADAGQGGNPGNLNSLLVFVLDFCVTYNGRICV